MEISLTPRHLEQLANLARESLPNESCAFLIGIDNVVTEILPMQNSDESAVSFSIEPQQVLHAYELAESKRLQVLGIFHSHPASPVPSSTDRKYMEINPVVWLIYSTTNYMFRAYIHSNEIIEVALKIRA
jgi:proteasome lid subunit RPN8/RPN11